MDRHPPLTHIAISAPDSFTDCSTWSPLSRRLQFLPLSLLTTATHGCYSITHCSSCPPLLHKLLSMPSTLTDCFYFSHTNCSHGPIFLSHRLLPCPLCYTDLTPLPLLSNTYFSSMPLSLTRTTPLLPPLLHKLLVMPPLSQKASYAPLSYRLLLMPSTHR